MKIVENGKMVEHVEEKCKVCGLGEIEHIFAICDFCGWEADDMQNDEPDYIGGANEMSLNQYKQFWKDNKEDLLKHKEDLPFYAFKKAREYYAKTFKEQNEAYYRAEDPLYDERERMAKESRLKQTIEIKEKLEREKREKTQEQIEYEEEKERKLFKILRNDFKTAGKYGMPVIRKQKIDLDKIDLWNFSKTKKNDVENKDKTIHFFTYDWHFDAVYDKPEITMEKLDQYYALLSPEFSVYSEMPRALQIYSTFKNRWCGAYWQKMGKIVIPTICCADEDSYEFCFDGIEEGSVVAISLYRREELKDEILEAYNKMIELIKPEAVICYGEPFPEMKGKIIAIDPFNSEELIAKMGYAEYMRKRLNGELYPSK